MTLDLIIYCKDAPDHLELATSLCAISHTYDEQTRTFNYDLGNDEIIGVSVKLKPFILCEEYERESVDTMIAKARTRGYEIPEGLIKKLEVDGKANLMENALKYSIEGLTTDRADYGLKLDKELFDYLRLNPNLAKALPEFSTGLDLVNFSQGKELYSVKLAVGIGSDKSKISSMIALAKQIAEKYNGVLYDPQSDSLGDPNVSELTKQSKSAFNEKSG
ncbi:hypothetical protein HYU21_04675, partial [Candidatus Woesearchaeota archaeon]|nr:hypothetical protein [Candidatus Woesearchaeota archaeon]